MAVGHDAGMATTLDPPPAAVAPTLNTTLADSLARELSASAARELMLAGGPPEYDDRFQLLAEKCREGTQTEAESREHEAAVAVWSFLSLLKTRLAAGHGRPE